jgi:hypothetical protein
MVDEISVVVLFLCNVDDARSTAAAVPDLTKTWAGKQPIGSARGSVRTLELPHP